MEKGKSLLHDLNPSEGLAMRTSVSKGLERFGFSYVL